MGRNFKMTKPCVRPGTNYSQLLRYTALFFAGFLTGVTGVLITRATRIIKKKHGFQALPDISLNDVRAPFPENGIGWLNCALQSPRECNDSISCEQRCGPAFKCTEIDKPTEFNGTILVPKRKYCLPVRPKNFECREHVGRVIIGFNTDTRQPEYKCESLFPDVFTGDDCNTYIGCLDPRDPTKQRAPLYDSVDKVILNPDVPEDFNGRNLYETVDILNPTNPSQLVKAPRYYCRCKSLDFSLTSFPHPFRCARDPCLSELANPPHNSVIGRADGTLLYEASEGLNCECGDPSITRLFTTDRRTTPCKPIRSTYCPTWRRNVRGYGENGALVCDCTNTNEIFIPCNNSYRDVPGLVHCKAFGAYMLDTDDPAAGVCIDPCAFCAAIASKQVMPNGTGGLGLPTHYATACQDDPRTNSACFVVQELGKPPFDIGPPGLQRRATFDCSCFVNDRAFFWDVRKGTQEETGSNQCVGHEPQCRTAYTSCDPETDTSPTFGPMCCEHNNTTCSSTWFGNICLPDAGPSPHP